MGSEIFLTGGQPAPAAQISPLPVQVMGGELKVLEGAPVTAVWSGPHGSYQSNRQVTPTDPRSSWIAGAGWDASVAAKAAGEWSDANKTAFQLEFPGARPGLLYGIIYVSWGSSNIQIHGMYSSDKTSYKKYEYQEDWAYDSGFLSLGKIFEPRSSTGMWPITFPKPIPFHIGLRIPVDNGCSGIYFCYSLDPAFAP